MIRVPLVVAVLVLPIALASVAGADPPTDILDPARDIAVYRGVVYVPVDSIDIVHVAFAESGGGLTGAAVRVVDLERRGLEDLLFSHRASTSRVVGILALLDVEGEPVVLVLAAVNVEPPVDGFSHGYLAVRVDGPGQFEFLNVTGVHDTASDRIVLTLEKPIEGRVVLAGALSGILGCDSAEDCESPAKVMGADVAPDGGADWIASVIPGRSFADTLPEDDGSVSGPLRAVYAALRDAA